MDAHHDKWGEALKNSEFLSNIPKNPFSTFDWLIASVHALSLSFLPPISHFIPWIHPTIHYQSFIHFRSEGKIAIEIFSQFSQFFFCSISIELFCIRLNYFFLYKKMFLHQSTFLFIVQPIFLYKLSLTCNDQISTTVLLLHQIKKIKFAFKISWKAEIKFLFLVLEKLSHICMRKLL